MERCFLFLLMISCTSLVGRSGQNEQFTQTTAAASKVISPVYTFGCRETISNYMALMASSRRDTADFELIDDSFTRITACFDQLQSVTSFKLSLPSQLNLSTFNTNRLSDSYYDQQAGSTIDRFIYRLPKLGPYDCYYGISDSRTQNFGEYGHLLLIDSVRNTNLLINIYFEYGGEQNISLRYFFLEGSKLYLYEGYCYDDGCRLWKTAMIQITKRGEVRIRKIGRR